VSSFRSAADAGDADLPPVLRSLRRMMRLAYEAEPRLLVVSFVVMSLAWLPEALGALWLKYLVDGVVDDDPGRIRWAAAGLAAAAAAGWLLRTIGGRVEMRFRDRATIELEAHVARLQGTIAVLEHHERPQYLDRLQLLREQVFLLNHLYPSLMSTIGSVGRLLIAVLLLMSVSPVLVVLVLFAVPTVVASAKRAAVERKVEEQASPYRRRARHLFELATAPGPAKELRVGELGPRVRDLRRASWQAWFDEVARERRISAAWYAAAWTVFGLGYVGAVVFVATVLDAGAGDVVLVLTAGAGLSRFVGVTVGQVEFLRWTLDASQRLVWLEGLAAAHDLEVPVDAPATLHDAMRFEGVSFAYPGTDRLVLRDVDLEVPAGSVVALVGENGAGKTTLVKLLCRFYDPTEGRITVDGTDLARIAPEDWRTRLSGSFQDYFRFEYPFQRSVGVGDLDRAEDREAVLVAAGRGGATDVVERLPNGTDTQLGVTWSGGVELSVGQWQKVALSRGFMRDRPLVCVLDEPTAALDAETEHTLFEGFAAASRAAASDGRITVLVSHRFSTVRMADLIVVVDDACIAEQGSHEQLMAAGGLYAELYETQAAGYR
jgi:ATP-binding cassette subfamily B protein